MPDDERTRSLLAATHAPPLPPTTLTNGVSKTEAATGTLYSQPLTEDPTFPVDHASSPPLPIASLPSTSLSTSPPITRRPPPQHRRTGSATVSSVLSSHAFPEAVTGVEVVKTLDLAEREERKRGRGVVVEETEEESDEEEEEEDGEGDAWGVRSEGDIRALLGSSAPIPSISTFSSTTDTLPSTSTSWNSKDRLPSRGTLSFDEPRSALTNSRRHVSDTLPTPTRARSDSLTSLLPPSPATARPKFARKAFSSSRGSSTNGRGRPSLHARSRSEVDGSGRRREGWLSALGGRVEEGDEDGEEEETRRKVVVVEVSLYRCSLSRIARRLLRSGRAGCSAERELTLVSPTTASRGAQGRAEEVVDLLMVIISSVAGEFEARLARRMRADFSLSPKDVGGRGWITQRWTRLIRIRGHVVVLYTCFR